MGILKSNSERQGQKDPARDYPSVQAQVEGSKASWNVSAFSKQGVGQYVRKNSHGSTKRKDWQEKLPKDEQAGITVAWHC